MRVLIVVPAYNEAESIKAVIADLRKYRYKDIAVVDDGSNDLTGKLAQAEKATVLYHVLNRGLGAALATGFEYARLKDYDVLVTFDADGQHKAKDIKRLLAPIRKGITDVVIGSRVLARGKMPWERRVLNFLSNVFTYLLFGVWTSDSQSGLRAFNKKAISCIRIKTDRMEVSSEFFKEIKDHGLRFGEVPIKAIYTAYGLLSSKQESWAAAKISLRLFLRLFR